MNNKNKSKNKKPKIIHPYLEIGLKIILNNKIIKI